MAENLNKEKYRHLYHLLFLLLMALVCYWPLSMGIFSAKNDNITQFLPVRFHVSEALRSGNLPLWNPYMYMGYPMHGDMQGGAWNPFVWLISAFGRYNVTGIHAEIVISIFLSGAGMYRLLGSAGLASFTRLTGAAAYLMCGYITDVGGSNLPFLWPAAFMPFVFAYFYQLLKTPSFAYAIKSGLALALLFVTGYPSFFIITFYILLAAIIIYVSRLFIQQRKRLAGSAILYQLAAAVFFLCLAAPAILSYWQILPFYQRGDGVTIASAMVNSLHPSCSLSLALPSVPFKNPDSFSTDLISRNLYFNIFFLSFLPLYFMKRKTWLLNFVLAGVIFFYLFSLGDATPVRSWCYRFLPLMDTFRHPANARLLVITGGIIAGSFLLQDLMDKKIALRYFRMAVAAMGTVLLFLLAFHSSSVTLFNRWSAMRNSTADARTTLKTFFDSLQFPDLLLLNAVIQLVFIIVFFLVTRKRSFTPKRIAGLVILNSLLLAQLSIPYTLVSKVSPVAANRLLNASPHGFPNPGNNSITVNSSTILDHFDTLGISGFYSKKISITDVGFTPTFMTPVEKLLNDTAVLGTVLSNPYAYFATSVSPAPLTKRGHVVSGEAKQPAVSPAGASFRLTHLTNNRFIFKTSSEGQQVLCLQQLALPGWTCYLDGEKVRIFEANRAFMAVPVPRGAHEIIFIYKPGGIMVSLVLSMIMVLLVIFHLLKKKRIEAEQK